MQPNSLFFSKIDVIVFLSIINKIAMFLNSFIISVIEISTIDWLEDWVQQEFEEHNIFFQYDSNYIYKILQKIQSS